MLRRKGEERKAEHGERGIFALADDEQVVAALPELKNGADLTGGVAVWAHLGGFVTGVLLVKFFENRRLVVRRTSIV